MGSLQWKSIVPIWYHAYAFGSKSWKPKGKEEQKIGVSRLKRRIRFRKIRNGQDLFEELLSFSKILFEKGNQQIPCRI
ncbi:hypothetical protein [Leptospira santarosai]|uniref:Uncharacterized protein n=2 Tax=Leptospira santarosai TaxID=28183 RepID=A0AB73MA03_9LEPT|nr:hypothetical protein [Leptospira santarosai]EKS08568.1 hypothetical protein LEP1GSC071_3552 [Leptospira santarosai str. JET]EMF88854.1 hypothetical protein LEP1GSC005_1724 [Leptospira santarosai str. ST188]EMM76216.1 hypothetical protein LEP1GSC040_3734 [Leptospira santarosai str. 2000030832]EMN21299.1 hypothetical protein LEP1GSC063_1283 [Leptospira santarosai serovar Arenal str. MAVJ 401]EMO71457.1 hypothetical protein LEP1GSC130_2094 [Leptospira santarosai str. 200403458]